MSLTSSLAKATASALNSAVNQANRRYASRGSRGKPRYRAGTTATYTRYSAPATFTLTSGVYLQAMDIGLGLVQIADVQAMYDMYKVDRVTLHLQPRYDPGQSGVTNNTNVWVIAACDPTNQLVPPTWAQIGAFDGAKLGSLGSGKTFSYSFSPKATNALASGNVAAATDWIYLSAAGYNIAHHNLMLGIQSGNTSDVLQFDYVWEITFSVKTTK